MCVTKCILSPLLEYSEVIYLLQWGAIDYLETPLGELVGGPTDMFAAYCFS